MKILISDAFDPSLPAKLDVFGEVTDDKEQLPDVEVVLVRSKTKCTREYIDQAKNLRLIIRGGVGLDNIDVEYARSKGIQVFNTAEASAVAELRLWPVPVAANGSSAIAVPLYASSREAASCTWFGLSVAMT